MGEKQLLSTSETRSGPTGSDRERRQLLVPLVHLVLEYVEVVGRRHCDDVVLGVPGAVQDFLVEVQTVHADLVLLALAPGADLAGLEGLQGLAVLAGCLQGDVPSVAAVEHPEEVVVRARHHHAGRGDTGRD